MDPKKNKLWIKMKKISRRKFNVNKLDFNRIKDGKFVEDKKELKIIGEEIFDNFNLKDLEKINLFIDICAAPGVYSKIIIDRTDSIGIGISLPLEKGGIEFDNLGEKYKVFYKDILDKNYKVIVPKKIDLGLASCVSYINDKNKSSLLNLKLIIASLGLILDVLKENGNLIINLTIKNIYFAFNIINILSKYFKNYKLWKSEKIWETKNTFYFFGYGFKNKIINNKLSNNNTEFNRKTDKISDRIFDLIIDL